eukprot:scaffold4707_cov77-Cyclotella_meneghiniana.AAC.8
MVDGHGAGAGRLLRHRYLISIIDHRPSSIVQHQLVPSISVLRYNRPHNIHPYATSVYYLEYSHYYQLQTRNTMNNLFGQKDEQPKGPDPMFAGKGRDKVESNNESMSNFFLMVR